MRIPYIGFGNETLDKLPPLADGDTITCPHCKGQHEVKDSDPPGMMTYRCGEDTYMAGIHGKCTVGVKPDVKGEIDDDDQ